MQHSRIGMTLAAALLLGTATLAGCGGNGSKNDAGMKTNSVKTNSTEGTSNQGRFQTRSAQGIHNIANLKMDRELSDRVSAIPGVRSAHVLMAGRTAYVAVTADENSGNSRRSGNGALDRGTTMRGTNLSPGSSGYGTGNGTGYGTGSGTLYKPRSSAGAHLTDDGRSMTGTPGTGGSRGGGLGGGMNGSGGYMNGMTGTDGTGPAGGAGDLLNGTGTVESGRGYHSMGTGRGDTVNKELKNRIAETVRSYDSNIGSVYVSANPDFVERVNGYADQARGGHPLSGFANEFRTLVERIFPTRE
ncbi:YhcN/YlaJ family sporulation lipoprotein [Paenibacillus glufosinatiresistens]|uniref:YhcN/YlaJ family sporulation lipoprotein n=1 Tax=Paenibacillus glufosinatiresistens TaxID=3070657 RepID=UPI00286E6CD0|nr:YhcN/YlaJ family sporulation lipoprotein [Paenibacillus sp. YX.27]